MRCGRAVQKGGRWGIAGWFAILSFWNLLLLVACDRAPREPSGPAPAPAPHASPTDAVEADPAAGGTRQPGDEPENNACVIPLQDPPPPDVAPVDDCPDDPDGRPEMPAGKVTFPDAPEAPELEVELALTPSHQTHGLMFRPTLGDDEGMLFSWTSEQTRSFWMRNTCLALDMLFIQADGTISKILENVPPMNTTPRRSDPCSAAHVLEVRAGWTRTYGVEPGQKMLVAGPEN